VDIFEGPVDPTFETQIHDFNPGITANGLFWTTRVHPANVIADPEHGRAKMVVEDFLLPDFHDVLAALNHAPPVAMGTLAMKLRWHGGGKRERVDDDENDFGGTVVRGPTSIWFHVESDDDFTYTSDTEGQTSVVGEVWRERNGVFHN
jgi:hypothetical protein